MTWGSGKNRLDFELSGPRWLNFRTRPLVSPKDKLCASEDFEGFSILSSNADSGLDTYAVVEGDVSFGRVVSLIWDGQPECHPLQSRRMLMVRS